MNIALPSSLSQVLKNRCVLLVFKVFVGAVFIYASFHKILDSSAFAESIKN